MKRQTRFCRLFTVRPFAASTNVVTNRKLTSYSAFLHRKVPNDYVIDAVDLIQNKTTSVTKLFPPSLDAGFATVEGIYLGKSVIRKVASQEDGIEILQDTNNSTADFEVNDTPLSR